MLNRLVLRAPAVHGVSVLSLATIPPLVQILTITRGGIVASNIFIPPFPPPAAGIFNPNTLFLNVSDDALYFLGYLFDNIFMTEGKVLSGVINFNSL